MNDKELLYYNFVFEDNYIVGFYAVLEGIPYDFYGQMADYPDVLESFPEGWYKFNNNEFILDENRKQEVLAQRQAELNKPTWQETIEAQTFYTAMITDTLIDSKEV